MELLMPTRDDIFPPKYLKASDLNGQPLTLVIKRAPVEALTSPDGKQERKTVLYFDGVSKKLPSNQTNWDAVVDVTGEADTDNWPGHKIEVYPTTTPMGGKTVPCVRVRAPLAAPAARSKPKPSDPEPTPDDEIPF